MIKQLGISLAVLTLLSSYGCQSTTTSIATSASENERFTLFSTAVKDSFYIQTQVPAEYRDSTAKRYPVVVVLDANFHFPMLATSVRQYEKGGLLPPLILVGIGYKSIKDMDSLRTRDYLYPAALVSDELKTIGGGERFRQFISHELLPSVDSIFRTNKRNRSLLGHSFGGYFTLYSLLAQATNKTGEFQNFIAASPSLWYHDFYLDQLPATLATSTQKDTTRLFISVGGAENPVWDIRPVTSLSDNLKRNDLLIIKGGIYNQLDHMDTGQLSFLKGLQAFYNQPSVTTNR